MGHYVGLDVSQRLTSVCVVDGGGAVVWRGRVPSEPEAIAAIVRERAPHAVRVGLETGPLSTWHWHRLRELGVPAVCLDARHAKAALSLQVNKTDDNDAHGPAQIVRTGWYREVRVKSFASHQTRALLSTRAQLVAQRRDLGLKLGGLLKTFGRPVGQVGPGRFVARVRELAADLDGLREAAEALLAVRERLSEQIARLDRLLRTAAGENAACHRLMTVPGVGPLTAVAFMTVIDYPERFAHSSASAPTSG
jgi:transposase